MKMGGCSPILSRISLRSIQAKFLYPGSAAHVLAARK